LFARRVAVTVFAVVLIVVAEVAATLSATAVRRPKMTPHAPMRVALARVPYGGEPHLRPDLPVPREPRAAAIRFVRDYVLWSDHRLVAIPIEDATRRVIRLLEQQPRSKLLVTSGAMNSVRIAPGLRAYLVTSAIGNFLVGRRGTHYLIVSLPGD
jgi:hypothetical protein